MNRLITLVLAGLLTTLPLVSAAALDPVETEDLLWIREEEKLARDTYLTLRDDWRLNVFDNISQSEQRHMDAVLARLEWFGLADPVVDPAMGAFTNPALGELYDQLVTLGGRSLLDALHVGAYIEELDIRDLRLAIESTDEASLINTYGNLLAGSRNHLRAFVGQIISRGVDYEAQVLEPDDVNAILDGYVSANDSDFSIHAGLNDAWYNPDTAGQGFFLTVLPEAGQVFLAWFTFETESMDSAAEALLGSADQRWLTAQGPYTGALAELEVTVTSGGIFDAREPVPAHRSDGSFLLKFENCSSGVLNYDIPSISRQGVIPIQRVAPDNVPHCEMMGGK